MKKSIVVFGIGKFGESVAMELANAGCDILAIDNDKERIHNIAPHVTCAVKANVCDTEALKSLGISNMDAAIVAITGSLDASIMATIFAKEAGVPYIIAKSSDETHSRILAKVGADSVTIPEHESGIRIARRLITGNVLDFFELSQRILMVELAIKPEWTGKSLRELDLRKKHKINVIALRQDNEVIANPDPDKPLPEDSTILVTVEKNTLNKLL